MGLATEDHEKIVTAFRTMDTGKIVLHAPEKFLLYCNLSPNIHLLNVLDFNHERLEIS